MLKILGAAPWRTPKTYERFNDYENYSPLNLIITQFTKSFLGLGPSILLQQALIAFVIDSSGKWL